MTNSRYYAAYVIAHELDNPNFLGNTAEKLDEMYRVLYTIEKVSPTPGQDEILRRLSYEYGHSNGYTEVLHYAIDLVDFFKEIPHLGR